MDDPTPRSKKDWETERTFGALDPKQGPLLFFASVGRAAIPAESSNALQIPNNLSASHDRRRATPFYLQLRDRAIL